MIGSRFHRPAFRGLTVFSLAVILSSPIASLCLTHPPGAGRASTVPFVEGQSRYAKVNGARVHYKDYGKGKEALVFVHGWTCDMSFWRAQVPAFEGKVRTILVDLPGHGQSDKPQVEYTQDLFARSLDAVLREAGVSKAVLVGHSMGTPVIREFYRKYPEKVTALVIVDGGLRPFASKEAMEKFIAPLRGPNYPQVASAFIDGMLGAHTPATLREEIKAAMLRTPQYVAVSAMDHMGDPDIWTADKINVPVLAILAKSPFWPPDNEQFFRSIAPDIDYRMWDGVSHFLMMERPQEFNETLTAFLIKTKLLKK